jgi:Holliday junction DNA helicase RuvA
LRAIPGIGKKTAERIALELKDAASKIEHHEAPPAPVLEGEDKLIVDDAYSALLNLGYPTKSAKAAIEKARPLVKKMSLEGLIKEALRILS